MKFFFDFTFSFMGHIVIIYKISKVYMYLINVILRSDVQPTSFQNTEQPPSTATQTSPQVDTEGCAGTITSRSSTRRYRLRCRHASIAWRECTPALPLTDLMLTPPPRLCLSPSLQMTPLLSARLAVSLCYLAAKHFCSSYAKFSALFLLMWPFLNFCIFLWQDFSKVSLIWSFVTISGGHLLHSFQKNQ